MLIAKAAIVFSRVGAAMRLGFPAPRYPMSSGEVSFAARLLTMTRCARGLAILVGVSAAQAERVDVVDDRRVADADGWVLELALIPIAPQDPFASCAVGGRRRAGAAGSARPAPLAFMLGAVGHATVDDVDAAELATHLASSHDRGSS